MLAEVSHIATYCAAVHTGSVGARVGIHTQGQCSMPVGCCRAAIAAVCFTEPEVVVAGQTPTDAAKAGLDCITAKFPFAANGRAMTLESTDGFVRVVARRDNHRIVGWAAVRAVGLPAALLIPIRGLMPGLGMVNSKIGVQPS